MALMLLLTCLPSAGITASATETGGEGTTTTTNSKYKVSKEVSELGEDGTYTITMKAWYEDDATVTIDPYDIVILFDQSSYAANQRSEIFTAAQNFLTQLQTPYSNGGLAPTDGSSHNVSLVGYGRINNSGESGSTGTGATVASANYNTGYYQSDGTFASTYTTTTTGWGPNRTTTTTGILWTEGNPPTFVDYSSITSTNAFMTATQASNILNNTYISKWNSGGSRLDAGLVLTNRILSTVANDGRQKMVLVFTNSVAMLQSDNTGYELRVDYLSDTLDTMKNTYGASFFVIGDLQASSPSNIQNTTNFSHQTNLIASENSAGNKQVYSYSNMTNAFNDMLDMIVPESSAPTVKDTITPAFEIQRLDNDNYAIEVYTAPYTGRTDGNPTFGDEVPATDCTVEVTTVESETEGTKQTLTVTGFDFGSNYVSDSPTHGNQLIIKVKTKVKDDFLGGNNVSTNTADSGIYDGDTPLALFDSPKVDVQLATLSLEASEVCVYLGENSDNIDNFIKALSNIVLTTATGKEVTIDATNANGHWGLASWADEYVNIAVETEHDVDTFLTEDLKTLYTITATVSLKSTDGYSAGGETTYSRDASEHVHVLKPTLTYNDIDVYYGEDAPTTFSNYTVKWSHTHDGKETTDVEEGNKMRGKKPDLILTYSIPDTSTDAEKKIATAKDIPVTVTVSIEKPTEDGTGTKKIDVTEYSKFEHTVCATDSDCTWATQYNASTPNDPAFLLHVIYGRITVVKEGDDLDENGNYIPLPNATFVLQDESGKDLVDADGKPITVTTDAKGEAVVMPLAAGKYLLKETVAPDGYMVNENPSEAEINLRDQDDDGQYSKRDVTVTVKDQKLYALPSSGSSGTYLFTISGVAVMMTTLLLFLLYQQKERRV